VREAWILPGGAELKTYVAAAQALALVGIARGFEALARRVRRDTLVAAGSALAALCLVGFWALDAAGVDLALALYLWVGTFQLLLIAQLWSFATDLYSADQGRRLFPVLGAGAALGALVGSQNARVAMRLVPSPSALLLVAAALLVVTPVLAAFAQRRAPEPQGAPAPSPVAIPRSGPSGIACVFRDPYLRLVAAFTVLLNWTTTLGEYALDRTLLEQAAAAVARGEAASVAQHVAAFKADYYGAIHLLVVALQLFAVSRVLRVLGERAALALLPAVAVIGAALSLGAAAAALPLFGLLVTQRVIENGIQHSIQNTARQALFLVTGPEARWGGKTFIDTATWRAGDALGALTVAGLAAAGADATGALACALALGLGWLAVVRALGREHRALCAA
jgi:AAA family ATP:ADP antiporter